MCFVGRHVRFDALQSSEEIERFSVSEGLDDAQRIAMIMKRGTIAQQCSAAACLAHLFVNNGGEATVVPSAVLDLSVVRGAS